MTSIFTIVGINIFIVLGLLTLILAGNIHSGFAGAVPLIKIHSGNKTLDHRLPKFYSCIDKTVKHSIKEQKDPYFKTEPTKDEVIECYHDVIAKESSDRDVNGKYHE